VFGRQRSALDEAHVLSLATVRPDGRPHVVPLWFHWDGETIAVFSKPQAVKVQNLLACRSAMVAVGEPDLGTTALLEVIGDARETASQREATAFAGKYQASLAAFGVTVDDFLRAYPMLIRLRPTRWLGWGHPGW
jgi:PPOX class probable F420-dependent enzyme